MFDPIDAINDIIDDINDGYTESEDALEAISDELVLRYESGEISLDDADRILDRAYDIYAEKGDEKLTGARVQKMLNQSNHHKSIREIKKTSMSNTEALSKLRELDKKISKLINDAKTMPLGKLNAAYQSFHKFCNAAVITGILSAVGLGIAKGSGAISNSSEELARISGTAALGVGATYAAIDKLDGKTEIKYRNKIVKELTKDQIKVRKAIKKYEAKVA